MRTGFVEANQYKDTFIFRTITMDLINLNKGDTETFGPEDELDEFALIRARKEAVRDMLLGGVFDRERVLESDPETVRRPNQKFALVSFIGPYSILNVKHADLQMCVRDYADNIDQARRKVMNLKRKNDMYCIYLFEMYSWIAVPPNKVFMNSVLKHEEYLHKMIIHHKYDFEYRKNVFEERKQRMTQNPDMNIGEQDLLTDRSQSEQEGAVADTDDDEEGYDAGSSDSSEKPEDTEDNEVSEDLINSSLGVVQEKIEPVGDRVNVTMLNDDDDAEIFDSDEILLPKPHTPQRFVVLSKIGDEISGYAVKIRGIFDDEAKAKEIVEKLGKLDPAFENYIAECYRWLPLQVTPEDIDDQVYGNEILDNMHKEYKSQKQQARQYMTIHEPDMPTPDDIYQQLTDDTT